MMLLWRSLQRQRSPSMHATKRLTANCSQSTYRSCRPRSSNSELRSLHTDNVLPKYCTTNVQNCSCSKALYCNRTALQGLGIVSKAGEECFVHTRDTNLNFRITTARPSLALGTSFPQQPQLGGFGHSRRGRRRAWQALTQSTSTMATWRSGLAFASGRACCMMSMSPATLQLCKPHQI